MLTVVSALYRPSRLSPRAPNRIRGLVTLHLRARSVPASLLGLVAAALIGWAGADYLMSREWASGPDARIPVVVGLPLIAAVLVSLGLAGRDEELERSTALRWRTVRTVHVGSMALAACAAVALTGLYEPQHYGAFELVRNVAGFVGLAAAGAVAVGARLAWAVPLFYAGVVYLAAPNDLPAATAWWTWPLQSWGTPLAVWTAAGLFLCGAALYAVAGARAASGTEAP